MHPPPNLRALFFFFVTLALAGVHCASADGVEGDGTDVGVSSQALATDDENGPSLYAAGGDWGPSGAADVGPDAVAASAASLPGAFMAPVTPVRNQGSCNICWAYATVAAMETNMLYRGKTNTAAASFDMSEQSLAQCVDARCRAGYAHTAAIWARARGVNNEGNASCGSKRFHVTSTRALPTDDNGFASIAQIKREVQRHGAVVSWIWASNGFQQFRSTGVFNNGYGRHRPISNQTCRGHFVSIVGWNDDLQAWRVKNSWGTGWGDRGYGWVGYESANIGRWPFWLEADYGDGVGGSAPDPVARSSGGSCSAPPPPDAAPPVITSLSPAHGTVIGGGPVRITATATDDVGVTSMIAMIGDAVVGTSAGPLLDVWWDSGLGTNQWQTLTIWAFDAVGNAAPRTASLWSGDLSRPVVAFTAPTWTPTTSVVRIHATATDNVGVTRMRIFHNGDLLAEAPGGVLSFDVDTNVWPDRYHHFLVEAVDAAGLTGLRDGSMVIDRHAPIVTAQGDKLYSGYTILGCTWQDLTAETTTMTIDGNVVFSGRSGGIPVVSGGSPHFGTYLQQIDWASRDVPDGPHALGCRVTDRFGRSTFHEATIHVQNDLGGTMLQFPRPVAYTGTEDEPYVATVAQVGWSNTTLIKFTSASPVTGTCQRVFDRHQPGIKTLDCSGPSTAGPGMYIRGLGDQVATVTLHSEEIYENGTGSRSQGRSFYIDNTPPVIAMNAAGTKLLSNGQLQLTATSPTPVGWWSPFPDSIVHVEFFARKTDGTDVSLGTVESIAGQPWTLTTDLPPDVGPAGLAVFAVATDLVYAGKDIPVRRNGTSPLLQLQATQQLPVPPVPGRVRPPRGLPLLVE